MQYYKYISRLVKDRKLQSAKPDFVIEGTRWLEEIVAHNIKPLIVIATDNWLANTSEELKNNFEFQVVSERDFVRMSATKTPSGVLALIPKPIFDWPVEDDIILILDQIRDPGNLGTLIRTCTAAGVKALILTPGTTNVYNPKVIRSTMGSLLRLPIFEMNWEEIVQKLKSHQIYAADMNGENYTQVNWQQKSALIIGNEAHGLSSQAKSLAHKIITVPIADQTESLNAAIAGSVILFEVVRQRS